MPLEPRNGGCRDTELLRQLRVRLRSLAFLRPQRGSQCPCLLFGEFAWPSGAVRWVVEVFVFEQEALLGIVAVLFGFSDNVAQVLASDSRLLLDVLQAAAAILQRNGLGSCCD